MTLIESVMKKKKIHYSRVVLCHTESYQDHAPAKEYFAYVQENIVISPGAIALLIILTLCHFLQVRRKAFQGINEVFPL